jgi:hypothetical protein
MAAKAQSKAKGTAYWCMTTDSFRDGLLYMMYRVIYFRRGILIRNLLASLQKMRVLDKKRGEGLRLPPFPYRDNKNL